MRLIIPADEDTYQAASLAHRLGRADRLAASLGKRHRERPDDPEAAWRYALALTASLSTVESEHSGHRTWTDMMQAIDDVLSAEPDHWPARYFRARMRALAPSGFSVYTMVLTHERDMAGGDLDDLAHRQAAVPWQPYFAATHVLRAVVAAHVDDWETVCRSLAAADAHKPQPVGLPVLGAVLCEPFVALHDLVDTADRATVARHMAAMFPDQPVVLSALTRTAG